MKNYSSRFFIPKNPFFAGIGSVFNFFGNYQNSSLSQILGRTNREAIASDSKVVGEIMRECLDEAKINVKKQRISSK
jgi:hypothetical protein